MCPYKLYVLTQKKFHIVVLGFELRVLWLLGRCSWAMLRYIVSIFVNVTMYPQYNNNMVIKKILKRIQEKKKKFIIENLEKF
jgi:hypothetical protein